MLLLGAASPVPQSDLMRKPGSAAGSGGRRDIAAMAGAAACRRTRDPHRRRKTLLDALSSRHAHVSTPPHLNWKRSSGRARRARCADERTAPHSRPRRRIGRAAALGFKRMSAERPGWASISRRTPVRSRAKMRFGMVWRPHGNSSGALDEGIDRNLRPRPVQPAIYRERHDRGPVVEVRGHDPKLALDGGRTDWTPIATLLGPRPHPEPRRHCSAGTSGSGKRRRSAGSAEAAGLRVVGSKKDLAGVERALILSSEK